MHSLRDIIFPVQTENQNKEIFPFTSAYSKYNSQIQSKQHLLQLHSGHFFLQKEKTKQKTLLLFWQGSCLYEVKMQQWWTGWKNGRQIYGQSPFFDAFYNQKSSPALLHSSASQKSSLKVWNCIAHSNPSKISNITLCSVLPPVTEPSTGSFLKGIHFRWANLAARWISFIRAQHKGIRYNVPACSLRGSLCVLSGSDTLWAGAFYLGDGEMIQILQNTIVATGIAIPCQGFFESKSKKGLHGRNRLFCLLLYAPLNAFKTRKKCNPDNLTCSHGPVLYLCVYWVCFHEMWPQCLCDGTYLLSLRTLTFLIITQLN